MTRGHQDQDFLSRIRTRTHLQDKPGPGPPVTVPGPTAGKGPQGLPGSRTCPLLPSPTPTKIFCNRPGVSLGCRCERSEQGWFSVLSVFGLILTNHVNLFNVSRTSSAFPHFPSKFESLKFKSF
jgi:hypothetical protein